MAGDPRIEEALHPHLGPVCIVKIGSLIYGLFFGENRRTLAEGRVACLLNERRRGRAANARPLTWQAPRPQTRRES